MRPDLTVSLVNHSNPELLRHCLRSIFATAEGLNLQVVGIDNSGDRERVARLRDEFPVVEWICNDHPLGFAANHNQALRVARGRHVCIVNDDTVVHAGAFPTLVRHLDDDPGVGMVGPRLLNADGSVQDAAFREITLRFFFDTLFPIPGRDPAAKRWHVHPAQNGDEPADVAWLLGACIVARREVLETAGFLDETLSPVAYMEDVDWCLRARRAGWRVTHCPAAVVTHYGGKSLEADRDRAAHSRVEIMRSALAYVSRHFGRRDEMLLRTMLIAAAPIGAANAIQGRLRRRPWVGDWRMRVETALRVAWMAATQRIAGRNSTGRAS